LYKFQLYMQVLKENVGLANETVNEMVIKISFRMAQCENNISEYQPSLYNDQFRSSYES